MSLFTTRSSSPFEAEFVQVQAQNTREQDVNRGRPQTPIEKEFLNQLVLSVHEGNQDLAEMARGGWRQLNPERQLRIIQAAQSAVTDVLVDFVNAQDGCTVKGDCLRLCGMVSKVLLEKRADA